MIAKSLVFILIVSATVVAVKKSFEGYKVFKVVPKTKNEVKILNDVSESGIGEFWETSFDVNHNVKIMVSKENQNIFLDQMSNTKIEVLEVMADLQKVIDNQLKRAVNVARNEPSLLSMSWDRYHNLEEIYNWLDELQTAYPDIVTVVTMGDSTANRPIRGVRVNHRPGRNDTLIGVLEGGLHAREWISPATVTWILKEFLTSTDPEIRALAETFEWHMFPVVNPDGYVYTFTDHRMWRKNRNTLHNTTCSTNVDDDMSNGVDLNRNFGFRWMTVGASSDPCSNTYAGPNPFSERESRAIAVYVDRLKAVGETIYYLAFHSYTQLVVIPYSHLEGGADVLEANNYADTYEIAVRSAEKLAQRFGTHYRSGVSAVYMYPMSGTSFDYVKYEADVPVTYLLELRDLGDFGFLLPPEQIIPNGLEVMDFLIEMDKTTRHLGYYSGSIPIYSSAMTVLFGIIFVSFVN